LQLLDALTFYLKEFQKFNFCLLFLSTVVFSNLSLTAVNAAECQSFDPSATGGYGGEQVVDVPGSPIETSTSEERIALKSMALDGDQKNVLVVKVVRLSMIQDFITPTVTRKRINHYKPRPISSGLALPIALAVAPINMLIGAPTRISETVDNLGGCEKIVGSFPVVLDNEKKSKGPLRWSRSSVSSVTLALRGPLKTSANVMLVADGPFDAVAKLEMPRQQLANLDTSNPVAVTLSCISSSCQADPIEGINVSDTPVELGQPDADLILRGSSEISASLDLSQAKKIAVKELEATAEKNKKEAAAQEKRDNELRRQQEKEEKTAEAVAKAERLKPITAAKQQCTALGFIPNTDKHAKCALEMLK